MSPAAAPDLTRGPLLRTVLFLAWPVIVAEGMHTAFHVVDVAWLKGLGKNATAAATTSMFAIWLVFSLASMVTNGVTAHVAQATGAGDHRRAAAAASQGLNLALILSLLVVVCGWFGAERLFRLIDTPPEVVPYGAAYLKVMSLGAPATFLYLGGAAVMRARGDTRTPMKIVGVSLAANVALAPFLIYGWGPFPRWGIRGAAVATILCETGSVLAFARVAQVRWQRPDWRLMRSIAQIGLPYFVMIACFSIVYLFFADFASQVGGVAAMAVVGVSNRLESICYLPADGFAAASATLVGQNLGAGNPRRAAQSAWTATSLMACLAAGLMILYLVAPGAMLGIFSDDGSVLGIGVPYLRVLALCQVGTGVEGVLAGAFAGSGYTQPVLIVHTLFSVVRVPLAWLMSVKWGLGLMGIAWTITATCVVRATVLTLWFARGSWSRGAVTIG